MVYRNNNRINQLKRPKKFWKWLFFIIVIAIVSAGTWIGFTFFNSINKITADSGKKGSILSVFDTSKTIKGQTEGRTNVLLLGNGGTNHPGGGLTDTMMVMSINWSDKKIALISVPRDLWVKLPNNSYSKINAAYYYGNQSPKITGGGGKVASDVISQVLGLPIHYYIALDFTGFNKVVDTVGGVDIYVEKPLYDPYYPAANMVDYDPLKITTGMHHMDGALALKYARSRETTSDFDRSRRQQQVLAAVKAKIVSLETLSNPKKITDLLLILGDHLRTNFTINELKSFWEELKTLDMENMVNKVFDTSVGSPLTSLQDERGYIIIPKKGINNYADLQAIAKNIFSAETQIATELKIEILNGTGQNGIATQISQLLKTYGYNVTKVGNATSIYPETIIYNCDGLNNTATVNSLAEILKATTKMKNNCGFIDIQIIIGKNSL